MHIGNNGGYTQLEIKRHLTELSEFNVTPCEGPAYARSCVSTRGQPPCRVRGVAGGREQTWSKQIMHAQ